MVDHHNDLLDTPTSSGILTHLVSANYEIWMWQSTLIKKPLHYDPIWLYICSKSLPAWNIIMIVDFLIEKGLAQEAHYIFFKKNGSYIIYLIDKWCLYTNQKAKNKEIKFHKEWCLFLFMIGLIF